MPNNVGDMNVVAEVALSENLLLEKRMTLGKVHQATQAFPQERKLNEVD